MFIIYGQKDYSYLIKQNKDAIKRLNELGAKFSFSEIENYTHEDMVLKFGKDDDNLSKKIISFVNDL